MPALNPTTNGNRRRVVVTGVGLVTPLGTGTEVSWRGVLEGRSGIRAISKFDASCVTSRIAGEVPDFEAERFVERKDIKKMDAFIRYSIASAAMALEQAGLSTPLPDPERSGVIVGVGMGGLASLEDAYKHYASRDMRRVSPFFIPRLIPNMASGQIAMRVGARGPSYATTSACSSGAHAIGDALSFIRDGKQDVMLAGGAEAPVCLLAVGGFTAMRALATSYNEDPTRGSRPFDAKREGFVIAEGAGMLVLEELEYARRRGATILGELIGFGTNCDAFHLTQPAPEGAGAARCMELALEDAGIAPEAVGYVNAHGTGTPFNDAAETQAVKTVFGEHARTLAVSSTKSMTGHLLGAAGAVEAGFTVLGLRERVAPPTINLDEPDAECDLDYVPHTARPCNADVAITNSFGFGGTNATLVFRRYDS